jgi:DNA modification methylase
MPNRNGRPKAAGRGTRSPESATAHIAEGIRPLARPIKDLIPDPFNRRLHDEASIARLSIVLKRFGQQTPIVVDADKVVRKGNATLAAAKLLGWTQLAQVTTALKDADVVDYSIADNRAGEFSRWDPDLLRQHFASMPEDAMQSCGFTRDELRLLTRAEEPTVVQDLAPEPLPVAVTQRGDVWQLGAHRIMCGESTVAGDVAVLMGKHKAALCATDPPYLVDYTGERVGGTGKDWSDSYREIEITDAPGFFTALYRNVLAYTDDHAALYCWHAHKRVADIIAVWRQLGILDHQQIIWVKPTSVFGSVFYHFRHEPCLMGWREGSKPRHDGDHSINSVWTDGQGAVDLAGLSREDLVRLIKDLSDVWEIDFDGKARNVGNEHPTQKPVEIFAKPIRKHTSPGDLVLEPFSGSGTQIIAAEQLGRRCYAMEVAPVFVDVAVRRWQKFTAREAVLEQSGKTWAKMAKVRKVEVPA